MFETARFDLLLADLRHAGLTVGITEVERLHRVFSVLQEDAPSPRLGSLIAAVVVKSQDQRLLFDQVYDRWLTHIEGDLESSISTPLRRTTRQRESQPGKHRQQLNHSLTTIALLLALGPIIMQATILSLKQGYDAELALAATRPPLALNASEEAKVEPVPMRERRFTTWVPSLTTPQRSTSQLSLSAAILISLTLIATLLLWLQRRRQEDGQRVTVTREDDLPLGPPRALLQEPDDGEVGLLSADQRDIMVWGLDHYVAEGDVSRHLDLPASVDATAKAAGIPYLVFQPPTRQREVWLWLDISCDEAAAEHLADQVQTALEDHRLPVRRATFWGIPDRLTDDDGSAFRPRELEEHRERARVALLTDGRILAQQQARGSQRAQIEARLRDLSHWPHLAVVDFSDDPTTAEEGHLATQLRRHHIHRLTPQALAGFLGGVVLRRDHRQALDEEIWSAATALCPAPFDPPSTIALARALNLQVSPWALPSLHRHAAGPGERLQWSLDERIERIEWLRCAEVSSVEPTPEATGAREERSFLQRSVRFWLQRYDAALQRHHDDPEWADTNSGRLLQAERGVLALLDPTQRSAAIAALFQLFQGLDGIGDWIERQLGRLTTLDDPRPGYARLEVEAAALSPAERARLVEMGFAPGRWKHATRVPGRWLLALGLTLGMSMGALLWGVYGNSPKDFDMQNSPPEAVTWRQEMGQGRWTANVATLTEQKKAVVAQDQVARVTWKSTPDAFCVDVSRPELEVWRCPVRPPRQKLSVLMGAESQRPTRITIGLLTPLKLSQAEDLAQTLLDSGTADLVLLGEDRSQMVSFGAPAEARADFRVWFLDPAQLLAGGSNDSVSPSAVAALWTDLAGAIRRLDGRMPAAELRPQLAWADEIDLEFFGLQALAAVDLEMVLIPAGRVTLGSLDSDPGFEMADTSDETPAKEGVTLAEFSISKFEVSHQEYKTLFPQHESYWDRTLDEDTSLLPVTDVTWYEAQAFCQALGLRFPTEAEWEYAARATTRTPWSFGSDASLLGEYAWFEGNFEGRPQQRGTKKPNPWGLYDMHGNVWEWVEDDYLAYKSRSVLFDSCSIETPCSVLRGGSFLDGPQDVRSANRNGNRPENRFRNIGFRCVRGPHPQP